MLEADEAVLALGVFQPGLRPDEAAVAGHPRFPENPWNPGALDRLVESSDILIIGASLSMVDAIASMEARGFRGRYRVISRRGQFVGYRCHHRASHRAARRSAHRQARADSRRRRKAVCP